MAFSAFFSGMEIAFVSSNRMLAEVDKERNGATERIIDFFYNHPNEFVSTMLVGNNIALVIYGILFADIFDQTLFHNLSPALRVTADTLLSTLIVIFTGEFLPKSFFKSNPNKLLYFFAIPAYICYLLLWPISRFSTLLSRFMLHLFGIKVVDEKNNGEFSKIDLDYLVQSSLNNAKPTDDDTEEVRIFQNALDFSDTKVRDCMIPRTEIDAVDADKCSPDELRQLFIESGHSKIIVYKGDIDNVIGYIHSSEMFRDANNWQEHIIDMPFVPETMAAQKLMRIFMQQKKSLGIVVDEFGGTSGIVSLEDIVEEIFGEIEDEHDNANYVAKQVSDNEYILSARLEISKLNDMFALSLPESDDYMTLGGLILNNYHGFPKLNEVIKIKNYELKVINKTQTKIELVRLKVL